MAKKGTCGACFRAMSLTGEGKVVRHGWSEVGGTRRVGQYGHVRHTGPCFGTGWEPYEVSDACTKAFLAEVLFPMGLRQSMTMTYLAGRPELVYSGRTWLVNETHARGMHSGRGSDWDGYGHWAVRLRPGDEAGFLTKWSTYDHRPYRDTAAKIPSYDQHHGDLTRVETARWDAIVHDGLYCVRMIAEWKPAEVAEVAKKVALVHAPNPNKKWTPACRFQLYSRATFNVSEDLSKVTCPKCLKNIEARARAQG